MARESRLAVRTRYGAKSGQFWASLPVDSPVIGPVEPRPRWPFPALFLMGSGCNRWNTLSPWNHARNGRAGKPDRPIRPSKLDRQDGIARASRMPGSVSGGDVDGGLVATLAPGAPADRGPSPVPAVEILGRSSGAALPTIQLADVKRELLESKSWTPLETTIGKDGKRRKKPKRRRGRRGRLGRSRGDGEGRRRGRKKRTEPLGAPREPET
jgi:hypothetical protein